jgi:hypothetical protein
MLIQWFVDYGIAERSKGQMRIVLVVTAVAAAILLNLRASRAYEGALVRAQRYRRRRHARELQHAKPGNVPARGDRRQPRLL